MVHFLALAPARPHLLFLDALVGAGAVVRVALARVVAAGEEAEADPVGLESVHAHHHVVVGALQPVQLALHVAQVLRDHLEVDSFMSMDFLIPILIYSLVQSRELLSSGESNLDLRGKNVQRPLHK